MFLLKFNGTYSVCKSNLYQRSLNCKLESGLPFQMGSGPTTGLIRHWVVSVVLQPAELTCMPNISIRLLGYYFGLKRGLTLEKVQTI